MIFRRKQKRIYLDSAAGVSGNPSSPHWEGRAAEDTLEEARVKIARLVEAKPDDIIFTSGATEANALAILGVTRAVRGAGYPPHILYLPSAHASIIENVKLAELEARPPGAFGRGATVEPLPIKDCQIDCAALAQVLRPETALVTMEAVCGETGVVWNTHEVARVLEKARSTMQFFCSLGHGPQSQKKSHSATRPAGPYLHIDASQAVWSEKLTRAHFGADLLVLDSSKVCETRGAGCLIAPRAIPLVPLYAGGGQERGLRPGSEAPALVAAFAEGLAQAAEGREQFRAAAAAARATLIGAIQTGIPDVLINEAREQAPHILNISLPGRDTDYLVALLDEAGFATSTVSACESASGEPSRAVLALWGDPVRAASTLRISWGRATTKADLERFGEVLIRAIHFIDEASSK